jgi:predicted metal-dependent hydrolase
MGEVTEGHPAYRRQVRFDWSTTPLRWVPGDPFSTHMINVLHLLLPTGEWWFIEAVNEATPLVDDEELRQAIRRSSSRRPGTRRPITSCSSTWPIRESTTRNPTSNGSTTGSPRSQGRRTNGGRHRCAGCGPTDTWQTPAALEQFTAVLGQRVIQNRGLDYAGADPVMLDLLRWYGAEKVEHRSLVFDVSKTCAAAIFSWLAGVRYLMKHDPTVAHGPRWRDWRRAARQYRVPGPRQLFVATPVRYLRPSHHPDCEASTEMAMAYLAKSPAAERLKQMARTEPACRRAGL